jgi:DNA-binding GntR family transcriptional regulator
VEKDLATMENAPEEEAASAADRVYRGVMRELEQGRMVPGQRLVEPDLARQFGVGRNAVREAMQRLTLRGVVDVSPHRSASIRMLDLAETLEILDVAASLTSLVARIAATRFNSDAHGPLLAQAMHELNEASINTPANFSRARRRFYRTLLVIAGNRELTRIFPAIGMHIIYSQYRSPSLQQIRLADYAAIQDAVAAGQADRAEQAGREHVDRVRSIVLSTSE